MAIIYSGYDYSGVSSSDWWLVKEGSSSPNQPLAVRIAIGASLPGRACGCAKEVGGFVHCGYLLWASQSARFPHPHGNALGSSHRLLSGGPAKVPRWPGMPHALVV